MDNQNFSKQIIEAVEYRKEYFNNEVLPKILEDYRLIHTCVKNILEVLIQKSLIKDDPYKLEKKISDVVLISNEHYADGERSLTIGTRLSDYESILDFICTYNKFSVESMNFAKIKKLVEFNSTFNWSNFSPTSQLPNTKGLAALVFEVKQGASAVVLNSMNDAVTKCNASTKKINLALKELSDFEKEVYKATIRKDIFDHPNFNSEKAKKSVQDEIAEIKRMFSTIMPGSPCYGALIEEIAKEDLSPEKEKLQAALLEKLKTERREKTKKQKTIDPKEILMSAIQSIGGVGTGLENTIEKIQENRFIIENKQKTFFEKFTATVRKIFKIQEPPRIYEINFFDTSTNSTVRENIEITSFITNIEKRILYYNSFAFKNQPGYQKIEKNPTEKILEFLNKQISDAQKLTSKINALDTFFKSEVSEEEKTKIKSLKMDVTTLKNSIMNANQYRADYSSMIEEQEQMKKLGISNE